MDGFNTWVHPNATMHLAEFVLRNGPSHGLPMGSQAMLSSLRGAVRGAAKQGIQYGKMMNVGGWELMFSPGRSAELLPVLKHALFR